MFQIKDLTMSQFPKLSSMSTPSKASLFAAIALAGTWVSSASAQAHGSAEPAGSSWGLGVGVAAIEKPYRDFDTETIGLPIVSFENRWISTSIPTFDVKLYSGRALSFRLRARYAGDGYEADDSPFLAGMDERKASLWAGAAVVWKAGFATVTGEFVGDAMGKSKGTRARLQMDRRFAAGKFGFTPRLAADWVDDKYVDYYYGVRPSEATTTRAYYAGEATTNIHAGLRVDYTPTQHHTLFFDMGASRFGSTVKDSPLVDEPNQTSIGLGYVYRF